MSKPPKMVSAAGRSRPTPGSVQELTEILATVRAEAGAVVADPARRMSVWFPDQQISLAEAEEEIALGKTIMWLERNGAGWFDTRILKSLIRRLQGNAGAEDRRREVCRQFVMIAMNELVSNGQGFGPGRMTAKTASMWIAKNLPEEVGTLFRGAKTTKARLAGAIYSLHDRLNRTRPTPADRRLAQAVRTQSSHLAGLPYEGHPFRDHFRPVRARLILDFLREALPE